MENINNPLLQAILVLVMLVLGTFIIAFFNYLVIKIIDFIVLEIKVHKYAKDFPFNIKEINRNIK